MDKIKGLSYENWSDFQIHEDLLKALKDNQFEKPLPIQIRALRASVVKDKNVLGAARTGSGKTLAYAIPLINRILSNPPSAKLKQRICKSLRKKEDFELIDGEMIAVEDMIVDTMSDAGSDCTAPSESSDTESIHSGSDSSQSSCPEAVILVPTRELATQVQSEIEKICKYTDIKSCCLIGGLSQDKQIRKLKTLQPQVIIATPGRLYDIVQSDAVDHLNIQSIASISTLVIDEADRMVQKGHFQEMLKILDIIKESKQFRKDEFSYRVYLFSATLTFLHELPDRLKAGVGQSKDTRSKKNKNRKLVNPKEHSKKNKIKQMLTLLGIEREDTRLIDLNNDHSFGRPDQEQLSEMKISCLAQEKDLYLYYFLMQNRTKRTLVFCNSKDCLRRLSNVLKYLKIGTLTLHADMDQKKRLSSLEKFRKTPGSVLIATDVAARGLDVKELDCVVHYQVPKTCESYIHRSGRTARLDRKGTSLTLCEPKEVPFYRRLCSNINQGKDLCNYDVDQKLKFILRDRVTLAQQCDKLDHFLRESKSERNWFVKAAKDCDIELDEEDLRRLGGRGKSTDENNQENLSKKRNLSAIQKQLNSLLNRSLTTRQSSLLQAAQRMGVEDA